MALTDAITLLEDVFINTSFFDTFMIPQLIIIGATLLFLTRKTDSWKSLAFPIMIMWNAFGMYISTVLYIVAGIVFVVDGLSVPIVGGGLKAMTGMFSKDRLKALTSSGRDQIREEKALDKEYKRWTELKGLMDKRDKIGTEQLTMAEEKIVSKMKTKGLQSIQLGERKRFEDNQKVASSLLWAGGKTIEAKRRDLELKRKLRGVTGKGKEVLITELKPSKPEFKKFDNTPDKSWKAYKKYGSKKKGSSIGLRLREAILGESKRLKRDLTDNEIKRLYQKIGRREGRY